MIDLKVIKINKYSDRTSLELVGAGERSQGVEKLGQSIVKLILTDSGTSTVTPDIGSDIRYLTSTNISGVEQVKAAIMSKIMDCERFVKDSQNDSMLPLDERLKSLNVVSIDFIKDESRWDIKILVENELSEYYPISI